uniref:Metalloendopeptidase n=1 Tax=Parastrongyloides trichosuri TaxID=131310 RepID=A0A0N4Z8U2_PARTI
MIVKVLLYLLIYFLFFIDYVIFGTGSRYSRNTKWTFPIPYLVLDQKYKDQVKNVIAYIQNETCLTFYDNQKNEYTGRNPLFFKVDDYDNKTQYSYSFIDIQKECYEYFDCLLKYIVQALGLISPHQRQDRDDFVSVYLNNVGDYYKNYFKKLSKNNDYIYGELYDFGSVAHYPSDWGNWQKLTTISSKDSMKIYNKVMGYKGYLTFNDRKILDDYFCGEKCESSTTVCKNGGYKNSTNCDQCICPKGLKGDCTELSEEPKWNNKRVYLNNETLPIQLHNRSVNYKYYVETSLDKKLSVTLINIFVPSTMPCREDNSIELYFKKGKNAGPLIICDNYANGVSFTTDSNIMWIRYNGEKNNLSFDIYINVI